jgi:hypothetical protein
LDRRLAQSAMRRHRHPILAHPLIGETEIHPLWFFPSLASYPSGRGRSLPRSRSLDGQNSIQASKFLAGVVLIFKWWPH